MTGRVYMGFVRIGQQFIPSVSVAMPCQTCGNRLVLKFVPVVDAFQCLECTRKAWRLPP